MMNDEAEIKIVAQKRAAWWSEHFKPGMTLADAFRLNAEIMTLFPKTTVERKQKAKDWENVPEFVL